MPRLADLQLTIGPYPSGPTGSVLDVPGAGLGHATVWRDEEPPPAGRGVARTGVTVLDPGGDLFASPAPWGGGSPNAAGGGPGSPAGQGGGFAGRPTSLTSPIRPGGG